MTVLTFKATEMRNASVQHISLVDRAATRIPFKVIKKEKPMSASRSFDLASVFKRAKPAVVPTIVGVITYKSEGSTTKDQIAGAGFEVDNAVEHPDGSVIFTQAGATTEADDTLIRFSSEAVLAVKGFRPYSMDVMADGVSFADMCSAQGFYPGINTTMDSLRSAIMAIADSATAPSDASTAISKLFDEARKYTLSLVTALPSKAFKLESIAAPEPVVEATVAPVAKSEPTEGTPTLPAVLEVAGGDLDEVAKAAKKPPPPKGEFVDGKWVPADEGEGTDPAAVDPKKAKKEEAEGITSEAVTSIVASQLQEFAAKMETLIGGVSGAVKSVSDSVVALSSRVEVAEGVAKAAKDALNGTVVLGGDTGDSNPPVVIKAENSGREIDTAFQPRVRRVAGR